MGDAWPAADAARQQFLDKPYASVQMLLLASIGLLLFGVLMAVSTTISAVRDNGGTGSIWGQAVKEGEFIALGLVIFWLAVRMSPRVFRALTYPMLFIALIALLAVLVPGVGVVINGARRWIDIGPLQVQPSEFAKLAILLWGADLLARKQQLGTLRRARHLFVPLLPGFVVVVALVMAEPDLGTTLCFMMILLGLLWMIGMPLRYFLGVLVAIAGAVLLLAVAAPYRLQRLTTFTDPFKDAKGSGYHTVEGLYALASGGLFGVGLGQGTSKYGYVPNANSDYVFAIIGEELGFIGCIAVLALFGPVRLRGPAYRPTQRRPVRASRLRYGDDLDLRPGGDQHRLRHRVAARHRHPAAVDLGRWHVAAGDVLRARHADLVRTPREPGRQRLPPGRAPRPPHPPRTLGPHPRPQALSGPQEAEKQRHRFSEHNHQRDERSREEPVGPRRSRSGERRQARPGPEDGPERQRAGPEAPIDGTDG